MIKKYHTIKAERIKAARRQKDFSLRVRIVKEIFEAFGPPPLNFNFVVAKMLQNEVFQQDTRGDPRTNVGFLLKCMIQQGHIDVHQFAFEK